jgi:hypothetical protein
MAVGLVAVGNACRVIGGETVGVEGTGGVA